MRKRKVYRLCFFPDELLVIASEGWAKCFMAYEVKNSPEIVPAHCSCYKLEMASAYNKQFLGQGEFLFLPPITIGVPTSGHTNITRVTTPFRLRILAANQAVKNFDAPVATDGPLPMSWRTKRCACSKASYVCGRSPAGWTTAIKRRF